MSSLFNRYWEAGVDTHMSNPKSNLVLDQTHQNSFSYTVIVILRCHNCHNVLSVTLLIFIYPNYLT